MQEVSVASHVSISVLQCKANTHREVMMHTVPLKNFSIWLKTQIFHVLETPHLTKVVFRKEREKLCTTLAEVKFTLEVELAPTKTSNRFASEVAFQCLCLKFDEFAEIH